jgi:hypothetical protein
LIAFLVSDRAAAIHGAEYQARERQHRPKVDSQVTPRPEARISRG